jgi:hypothetical protein
LWAFSALAAPPADPLPVHTVILGVVLNGAPVSAGEAFLEDADAHLLASAAFLQRLNLRTDTAMPRMAAGLAYFDMRDMPGVQVQRDAARAQVTLLASSSAFYPQAVNANGLQAALVQPYAPGGFVNYDVALTQTPQADTHDALLGFGLFAGVGLLTNTFALRCADFICNSFFFFLRKYNNFLKNIWSKLFFLFS